MACTYTWRDILNAHLAFSYHVLKGNESQLGDLLHNKICFNDEMDLLSFVQYQSLDQSDSGNNKIITDIPYST